MKRTVTIEIVEDASGFAHVKFTSNPPLNAGNGDKSISATPMTILIGHFAQAKDNSLTVNGKDVNDTVNEPVATVEMSGTVGGIV